jgi:hypothetical protein
MTDFTIVPPMGILSVTILINLLLVLRAGRMHVEKYKGEYRLPNSESNGAR